MRMNHKQKVRDGNGRYDQMTYQEARQERSARWEELKETHYSLEQQLEESEHRVEMLEMNRII